MTQSLEKILQVNSGELQALDGVSEADKKKLLELFEVALEAQHRQTEEAIDAGLQIVPAFLRKAVKKIMGGG